ncbi:O-antigen ligase family protein [Gottfriedia luciferensis]|uniref:O-antigen ligase family protein n=1 Tax=Gottfriedia luciferensis TaxID=178774 RepID=UPI000B45227E|nr:O-antigen ligase family protein [Gottfriedia luciferensis]
MLSFEYIRKNYEKLMMILLMVYFFFIPFSVSTVFQKIIPGLPSSFLISGCVFGGLVILYFMVRKTENFHSIHKQEQVRFLLVFILPIIFSLLVTVYNYFTLYSVEYGQYLKSDLIKRLINYVIFFSIFYISTQVISKFKNRTLNKIVWAYVVALLIITIVGVWQFFSFLYNIPFLNISTRSFVHSVGGKTLFDFRLTSFADEPSYLAPFLVDLLIIGYVMVKSKFKYGLFIFIPTIFVLILSYSLSGYVNLAILCVLFTFLLLTSNLKNKKIIFYILGLLCLAVIAFYFIFSGKIHEFLEPIIGRLAGVFDIQKHSRMYMYAMPFVWVFDHSWLSALFGYGPGSFEFIQLSRLLPNGKAVSTTSNNIFVDLIFEHGLFGFVALLYGFVYMGLKLFVIRNKNDYYLFSLFLFIHLIVTSLYRGDFVTPRFWGILIIVFIFLELGKRKVNSEQAANKESGIVE